MSRIDSGRLARVWPVMAGCNVMIGLQPVACGGGDRIELESADGYGGPPGGRVAGTQWLGPRQAKIVEQDLNCWCQEINGWGPGTKWLMSRNQWLVARRPLGGAEEINMVGAQETNGWDPGNQWLGPRQSMVGAQETMCWGPGKKW